MRYFFLLRPNFEQLPLAMMRDLYRRDRDSTFMGLVEGRKRIYREAKAHTEPEIQPLYRLWELEQQWIRQPLDPDKLKRYEEMFGPEILNRMVSASRQIGAGWVTHSYPVPTPLKELSEDSDTVRKYLVGSLQFFIDRFEELEPDLVMANDLASHVTYPLARVAEYCGVEFRTFGVSRVGSKGLFKDRPEDRFTAVDRTFREALTDRGVVRDELDRAREHLESFRDRPSLPDYSQIREKLEEEKRSVISLVIETGKLAQAAVKKLIRGTSDIPHTHSSWDWKKRKVIMNLRTQILRLTDPFPAPGTLPDRPFVYFPLHITPEVSTMIYAPFKTNQLAVVEAVSKSLPMSKELLVKENSKMLGQRPTGFYRRIRNMPGVSLASPHEDTFHLIRESEFVCTITGTAAWEALQLGRKALILGEYVPFKTLEQGFVQCTDLTALPGAVAEVPSIPSVDRDRLILFLAALFKHSFDVPREMLHGRFARSTLEAHSDYVRTLCDYLLGVEP